MRISSKTGIILTRGMFRIVTVLALLAFLGVFVYAFNQDQYNVPPEGMRAPFGSSDGRAQGALAAAQPAGSDLATQNFSSRELSLRLTEIVAEVMSFDKSNFVYNSGAAEQYFTPAGYKQYRDFLTSTAFEQTLREQGLQSGAYVEQEPLEVTSGVFGGAYKWLFEVPVTISFIPEGADTYRNGAITPQNRRILLRVQFTRATDPQDPDAVRVEIWQVLPPRRTS